MAYVTTDRSGVPFSSSAPSVIGPSGGYSSGGTAALSVPEAAVQDASNIIGALNTTDGDYQKAIRELLDYSDKNSAFNAAQAAVARSWNADQNRIAMDFSAAEAQKNRDWQEMLSNTSHQRAVKDLIAAGLNPVLSAAAGASTPSGSSGSGFASGGSSASADSASGALSNVFASLINTSAQSALQEQLYDYQNALQDKQHIIDLELSANDLKRAEISSAATITSAYLNSEAARYGHELSSESSHYSTDQGLVNERERRRSDWALKTLGYNQERDLKAREHEYDKKMEEIKHLNKVAEIREEAHGRMRTSMLGTANYFLDKALEQGRKVDVDDPSTWPTTYF